MKKIRIGNLDIAYELLGKPGAPSVVITPGGRFPYDTAGVPQLAEAIADQGYRVLLWDRPNCGSSDICFDTPSESGLQADVLLRLIAALELGSVAMLGGSGGSRIALLAAARAPEQVSHLVVWWISGGPISLAQLATYYCGDSAMAAAAGGMEAVAALPGWREQISRNPKNRDIILSWQPAAFIERMQQWAAAYGYSDSSPVPGLTEKEFSKLVMPTMVFRSGESDISHTRRTSEWVHECIPGSILVEPPWPDQEWNDCMKIPSEPGRGRFERWPLLARQILDFLNH